VPGLAETVLEALRTKEADVVVLTEFRDNEFGLRIRRGLESFGLRHQSGSHADGSVNAVLIASRKPIEERIFAELNGNAHRCVMARLGELNLFGLYFPQKQRKRPVFEFLVSLEPTYVTGQSLLIGDFNTGKHHIDEEGATFHCSEYMERLEANGWVDAWRHFHFDTREFTWKSAAGNGFRLDHAFVSRPLLARMRHAGYSHSERESGASDHSALILEID
jgi:exonuclease III